MSNVLGCGDNLPDGACEGKRGNWKLKINKPFTRKVAVKKADTGSWDILPNGEQLTSGEIGWQIFTVGAYEINGTVTGLAGGTLPWYANLPYCLVSDDIQDKLSVEIRPKDPNYYFTVRNTGYVFSGATFALRYPTAPTAPYQQELGHAFVNTTLTSPILGEPFGYPPHPYDRPPFFLDGTVTRYPNHPYPYVGGLPHFWVGVDETIIGGVGDFTIDSIEQVGAVVYYLVCTLDGNPVQARYYYTRPERIIAIQDGFLPDFEKERIITEPSRKFNLNLQNGYFYQEFLIETTTLFVDEILEFLPASIAKRRILIYYRPFYTALPAWLIAYKIWLQNKVNNGDINAIAELANLEDPSQVALIWAEVLQRTLGHLYETVESPDSSELFSTVCWDCRSGCPDETCFKCIDNVDQKICCYGTGGKAIATVGLDEDIPDC
jgi:hypothetical protein